MNGRKIDGTEPVGSVGSSRASRKPATTQPHGQEHRTQLPPGCRDVDFKLRRGRITRSLIPQLVRRCAARDESDSDPSSSC